MKTFHLTLFLCCLTSVCAAAQIDVSQFQRSFSVKSDSLDEDIPKGYYILEGSIRAKKDSTELMTFVNMLSEGKNHLRITKSGYFSLILKTTCTHTMFRRTGYQMSAFEAYDIQDRHRINIVVYLTDQSEVPKMVLKPVIYASSEVPLDLKIKVKPTADFVFTYPQLPANNTWDVHLENEQFITQDGQKFPYLFWESKRSESWRLLKNEVSAFYGSIVSKDQIVSFLDSTLSLVGFNFREKTDFITFWAPRMMQNEYNFVQFFVQETCDQIATYEFEPTPDSFNRFYMAYAGYDSFPSYLKTEKQFLKPFIRTGFQILEWGGSEFQLDKSSSLSTF